MKINVKHLKTAVKIDKNATKSIMNNEKSIVSKEIKDAKARGIIYDTSKNSKIDIKDETKNIRNKIEERVRNVKNLYSIFNMTNEISFTNDKDKKRFCKDVCRRCNVIIKELEKHDGYKKKIDFLENLCGNIKYVKGINIKEKDIIIKNAKGKKEDKKDVTEDESNKASWQVREENLIKDFVSYNIRKSLKNHTELLKQLVIVFCHISDYKKEFEKIDKDALKDFFEKLDEDYHKKEQIKQISSSIEKQNVKVQCFYDNQKQKKVLCLSNAGHKKKKYLFEMLKDYIKDPKGQASYIKELIALYLGGEKEYIYIKENPDKLNGWGFSAYKNEDAIDKEINNLLEKHWDNTKSEKLQCDKEIDELLRELEEINEEKIKLQNEKKELYIELNKSKKDKKNSKEAIEINSKKAEIKAKNDKQKQLKEQIKRNIVYTLIMKQDIAKRLKTSEDMENADKHIYWVLYINDIVYDYLVKKRNMYNKNKIKIDFLARYVFDKWTEFICTKFIDEGKAVYHFAMPDCRNVLGQTVSFGEINPKYANGITSFDYEMISAREDFDREMATYITFAVNNFANSVCTKEYRTKKNKSDSLTLKFEVDDKDAIVNNAIKNILRYFGGMSCWNTDEKNILDNEWKYLKDEDGKDIEDTTGAKVIAAIQKALYNVRNKSFHYTAIETQEPKENYVESIIKHLYNTEYVNLSKIYRGKWYSNNVLRWYGSVDKDNNIKCDELDKLMTYLYSNSCDRSTQIPSFKNIIKKSRFSENGITSIIKKFGIDVEYILDNEERKKYESSLYFVLKEIYYYKFIQDKDMLGKFYVKVEKDYNIVKEKEKNNKEKSNKYNKKSEITNDEKALKDFFDRVKELYGKNMSFGEMCQYIMTDYNMQNNQIKTVDVKKENEKKKNVLEEKKYEHYPLLLYKYIRETFLDFLEKDTKYKFLWKPSNCIDNYEDLKEDFCSSWNEAKTFEKIEKKSENNYFYIMSWYITAHMMTPRYLNKLIGALREYICRTESINRRSNIVTGAVNKDTSDFKKKYTKIVKILEFALLFSDRTSNNIKDYFENMEDYCTHLESYVDIPHKNGNSKEDDLLEFCRQEVADKIGENKQVNLYCDAENPIMNRNIVKSMMYGHEQLIEKVAEKIDIKEIEQYYKLEKELEHIFNGAVCKNEEEQRRYKEYENKKNRIELVNIRVYTEIINELYSKMVSWCYLRERDLIYFQLGYHYIRLFLTDMQVDEKQRSITLNDRGLEVKDGLILYQIVAIYTYGVPFYLQESDRIKLENDKNFKKTDNIHGTELTSIKVNKFYQVIYSDDVYNMGLELFGKEDSRDENVKMRNNIDHFRYFILMENSIVQLYSKFYTNMFAYNSKLHKSIPVVLLNTLNRYFVDGKIVISDNLDNDINNTMEIEDFKPTMLTYKNRNKENNTKDREGYIVKALDSKFICELFNILNYNNKRDK